MTCFFISTAATVKTICKIAIIAAAVFRTVTPQDIAKQMRSLQPLLFFPYVLRLRHLSEALSLIYLQGFWEHLPCRHLTKLFQDEKFYGSFKGNGIFLGRGRRGCIILFPQYEQNFVSSDNSAPHFEHLIISLLSFILLESAALC